MQALAPLGALGELWYSADWREGADDNPYHPKH